MIMDLWTFIAAVCLAFGLSAACGFRAFLPPLLIGIFSRAELITLGESWQWFSSDLAIALLAIAALLEICAYFVPWLDNFLDILATPSAITAGTILSCASLDGITPSLQWILAIIAGVGVTGSIQLSTIVIRGLSTTFTGGIGNPIFTLIEDVLSILLIILASFIPILAVILAIAIILSMRVIIKRLRRKKRLKDV